MNFYRSILIVCGVSYCVNVTRIISYAWVWSQLSQDINKKRYECPRKFPLFIIVVYHACQGEDAGKSIYEGSVRLWSDCCEIFLNHEFNFNVAMLNQSPLALLINNKKCTGVSLAFAFLFLHSYPCCNLCKKIHKICCWFVSFLFLE